MAADPHETVCREPQTQVPQIERLMGIDMLRAVGALLVLAHHGFWGHLVSALWERPLLFWVCYPFLQGFVGVHLFLVVSGFCIHARAARKDPNQNPAFASFWRRRLRRLYPPYLAAVALTLVVLLATTIARFGWPGGWSGIQGVWAAVAPTGAGAFASAGVTHILMLFPFSGEALNLYKNPVFWTLALEEQLYLMYFIVPRLRRRFGMGRTVLIAFVVTTLWRAVAILGPLGHQAPVMSGAPLQFVLGQTSSPAPAGLAPMALPGVAWITLGPSRWFEWVLGALAVELAYGRVRPRGVFTSIPLAVVAGVGAMVCQWSRLGWVFTDSLWGIAFFIAVNRVVMMERSGWFQHSQWARGCAGVGIFSYSIYLVHEPILRALQGTLSSVLAWPVALPLGMAPVLPLAWVFFRAFEAPAINWSRRASERVSARP